MRWEQGRTVIERMLTHGDQVHADSLIGIAIRLLDEMSPF